MTGTRKRHKSKKIRLTVPDRILYGMYLYISWTFYPSGSVSPYLCDQRFLFLPDSFDSGEGCPITCRSRPSGIPGHICHLAGMDRIWELHYLYGGLCGSKCHAHHDGRVSPHPKGISRQKIGYGPVHHYHVHRRWYDPSLPTDPKTSPHGHHVGVDPSRPDGGLECYYYQDVHQIQHSGGAL